MFERGTRKLVTSFLCINFVSSQNLFFKDQPIVFIDRYFKQIIPQLDTCSITFLSEDINQTNSYINEGNL